MVSRRLIESYQKRSTKTLILHTSNHSFISSPWKIRDKDRHQIFVSPTTTSQGSNLYRGKERHLFPLRIHESSIELQDVIELCTPPPGTCRGGKIVNTVHHIVSQLSGLFDLRRFIELVDQEKWDEDAASFMALRQTLLTTLISTDKGLDIQSSRYDRIVVDLTDPILSTTGLDTALFNIILREFVTTRTTETRLIVVNNAQEYLRRDSLLSKSLLDLARIGEISNSLLINTLELLTIDPMFISLSDYIIRGYPNPRSWVEHCLLHAPSDMSISHEPQLRPGQIIISSGDFNTMSLMYPNTQIRHTESYSTIMDISELDTHSCQENLPLPSEVTELRKEEVVPRIISPEDFETKPDQGRLPYDTIADFDLNSSVMYPLDVMEGSIPLNEDLNQETFIETSHIVRNKDTFERYHERVIVGPSGDMDQSNPILLLVDLVNNHPQVRYFDDPSLSPNTYDVQPSTAVSYPEKFATLVKAIFSLSGGYTNTPVDYSAVKKQLGTKDQVKALGFKNATRMLKKAWELGLIRMAYRGHPAIFLVNNSDGLSFTIPASPVQRQSPVLSGDSPSVSQDDAQSSTSDSSDEEPEESDFQDTVSQSSLKRLMCFFPLMAVFFTSDRDPGACITKAAATRWLRTDFLQNLGFMNNGHYYSQAIKHKIIKETRKTLTLLPQWHQFAQAVLLRFEASNDRDIGHLLAAIESEVSLLDSRSQTALRLSTQPSPGSIASIIPMVASPLPIIDSEISHKSRGVPFGGKISHLPTKFLPLVSAMLKVTGNKLAVPVQRQSISQALAPGTDLKSLGFTSFNHYLKQAIEARIVGTGDDGAQSSVHLISDLEQWCHAYVVRHLPPASKILSGPYAKGTAFYPLYQMARSLMMTQFLQEVPVNWVNKLVFRKNPTLLQDHGYASGKYYTKAAVALGVASLSSSGYAYILRYEEAWSRPAP